MSPPATDEVGRLELYPALDLAVRGLRGAAMLPPPPRLTTLREEEPMAPPPPPLALPLALLAAVPGLPMPRRRNDDAAVTARVPLDRLELASSIRRREPTVVTTSKSSAMVRLVPFNHKMTLALHFRLF